jgi:HEAT repeat protein
VMKAMFLTKLKIVAGMVLAVSMLGGAGAWSYRAAAHDAPANDEPLQQENQRLKRELADANEKVRKLEEQLAATKGRSRAATYKGKPAEYWIEQLRDRDVHFRQEALTALGAIAEVDRSVVPVIEDSLQDKDVGFWAAEALARIGPDAIPKLAGMLKDTDVSLRQGAAIALAKTGPKAASSLVEALKDTNAVVRNNALSGLIGFVRHGKNEADIKLALPAVITIMRDANTIMRDPNLRLLAVVYLEEIGPSAAPGVPALMEATNDQNREVRLRAISALGRIGPAAKPAVPALLAAMNQAIFDKDVQIAVEKAIANIDPDALRKPLKKE